MQDVADNIQKHYPKVDNSKMNKAIQDINEYLKIESLKNTIMFYYKHNEMKVEQLPEGNLTKKLNPKTSDEAHNKLTNINGHYTIKFCTRYDENTFSQDADDIPSLEMKHNRRILLDNNGAYSDDTPLKVNLKSIDMYLKNGIICNNKHMSIHDEYGRYTTDESLEQLKNLRKICVNDLLVDDGYLTDKIIFEEWAKTDESYEKYMYFGKHKLIIGLKCESPDLDKRLYYASFEHKYTNQYQ